MNAIPIELPLDEAVRMIDFARLVAIRWDAIPWCLVLDMDAPVSEATDAPLRRLWIVFDGVSDVTWRLDRARLPNGCLLASAGQVTTEADGGQIFEARTMVPSFDGNDLVQPAAHETLRVHAKRVIGIASGAVSAFSANEIGLERRRAIASDEEMTRVAVAAVQTDERD